MEVKQKVGETTLKVTKCTVFPQFREGSLGRSDYPARTGVVSLRKSHAYPTKY